MTTKQVEAFTIKNMPEWVKESNPVGFLIGDEAVLFKTKVTGVIGYNSEKKLLSVVKLPHSPTIKQAVLSYFKKNPIYRTINKKVKRK